MSGRTIWTIALVGATYAVVGVVLGALSGSAASAKALVAWRWAAWVVSAVVFGGHIIYEQVAQNGGRRNTALRVACAAALGGFALAVAANVHGLSVGNLRLIMVLSLVIWPVMIGLPAFVVALVAADLLARVRRA